MNGTISCSFLTRGHKQKITVTYNNVNVYSTTSVFPHNDPLICANDISLFSQAFNGESIYTHSYDNFLYLPPDGEAVDMTYADVVITIKSTNQNLIQTNTAIINSLPIEAVRSFGTTLINKCNEILAIDYSDTDFYSPEITISIH